MIRREERASSQSVGVPFKDSIHEARTNMQQTDECLLWSADGASLAFRTDRHTDGVREVQVLNIATGTVTEVSSTVGEKIEINRFARMKIGEQG